MMKQKELKGDHEVNTTTTQPNETVMQKDSAYVVNNLNLWYGDDQALIDVNLDIKKNEVTAIIGPSGCGKSTFIKTLNRMVEPVSYTHLTLPTTPYV